MNPGMDEVSRSPPQSLLGVSNINILWAVMGGQRLSRHDPQLAQLVDRLNKMFRAGEVTLST